MSVITQELSSPPIEESSAFRSLLSLRDFRLLWIGEGISLIGDQFYLIALPWLALQLTGDAFIMGSILAIESVPRALFMLIGGVLTDRFSPRKVMLVSNIIRMGLVALLALTVLSGVIELWMVFVFALVFGLADAFFFPAQSAIIPQLVSEKFLQLANAIVQGTAQLSMFAGPVLAGILIAALSSEQVVDGGEAVPDITGIGIAFGIDAITFLFSAIALWMMKVRKSQSNADEDSESMWASLRTGLQGVWNDEVVRGYFFLIAASNFLINGPIWIGIPYLADTRYPEGAAAFGIIISAFGGGSLIGTILAAILPKLPNHRLGILLGVIWSGLGIGVVLLGLLSSTFFAALIGAGMGLANGYVVILFITWLQERAPEAMLGRIMSMLMFASVGLNPIAYAFTGAIIEINTTALFVGSGALMTGIVLIFMLNPLLRTMGETQSGTVSSI